MAEKERQFAELHADAVARINEKDNRDLLLDDLKHQLAKSQQNSNYWQDKFIDMHKKKKKVESHISDVVREIDFMRSQSHHDKRTARRAQEETRFLRQQVEILNN